MEPYLFKAILTVTASDGNPQRTRGNKEGLGMIVSVPSRSGKGEHQHHGTILAAAAGGMYRARTSGRARMPSGAPDSVRAKPTTGFNEARGRPPERHLAVSGMW